MILFEGPQLPINIIMVNLENQALFPLGIVQLLRLKYSMATNASIYSNAS